MVVYLLEGCIEDIRRNKRPPKTQERMERDIGNVV